MKRYIIPFMLLAGIAAATTNEITSSITLKVNKNATQLDRRTGNVQIQMAGTRYNIQTGQAGTAPTFLEKGSVGTPGICYMRNLATNLSGETVGFTFDGGTTTNILLEAGEAATFRIAPAALVTNWTAGTTSGNCDFEFTVVED